MELSHHHQFFVNQFQSTNGRVGGPRKRNQSNNCKSYCHQFLSRLGEETNKFNLTLPSRLGVRVASLLFGLLAYTNNTKDRESVAALKEERQSQDS